ncbi:death-inducer obliterator 1 [Octopus bimaculoides]|nr:death-inducer obliterator 1 [Octopus bimaculoides]|eukprot:XP_014769878.1 PREDICTED: death-inducer obliterator 1-like isoform X1 [Octopus bimaculoides]
MDIGPPGANNNRFGGPNRFDSSRNQFEGSQFPMGPGQGGQYGMRNEEPDHNVERQGMKKNFSFMDSDMRTQGPNQNPQFPGFPHGPPPDDRGFGRGPPGFNFNQGPRGGPRFNQGPPFGPGFNQGPPRGPPNQNRPMLDPGDNRMGPREMENVEPYGFTSQRRREPSPNRQSSENQFGCFPPRDNTAWTQENSGMAKNQPMPNRSLDGKIDKMEVPLKGSEEPSAKIPRKDDDKNEAGVGKLDGQQWPKQDSDSSSNEQRNLKDGPQDFQNNKMPMKNDNWGQLDPGQPSGDQGPNFRNRGQQQPSPGPPQFERPPFKGSWGPQMQRMGPGPGFNVNMQAGGPPPPPRMLINIRPEFNPRMCPPGGGGGGVGGGGTGPPYREMMMRDGGVGPPFRGDKEGEQFSEGPGDNRPEGRMPPDCRPNSMGFPKNRDGNMDFPGADEREMMTMGSARRGRGGMMMAQRGGFPGRPNLQQRDCHDMNFPNMNRDDGNCRPDSLRNDAPPFNWSGEPRMSSKNQLDSWMNRERAQWEDNRCDFGNNNNNNNKSNNSNKPWGHPQGSPAPPGRDRDMDPAFHKISNPDFYDPMNRVNRLGDMNNRLYNADRCNRPPPAAMPPSRDLNHNRFNSSSSDQQFWNERDRNFPPKEFDVQRGNRHPNERFHRGDFLPPYGETIDYAHRPAREMFEPDSDLARNKPPAVFDYGHKHANYLGRPDPSRDMDFQGNKNLPPDHMRGDRGRMFPENEHSPFQGNWLRDGDRPRNCDKEDMMRDMERMRNRDRDIDLRDRDCRDRDRGRPIGHDSRERERLRERDKFRDGQGDREGYLRGRERMDEEDKWVDRKHDDRKYDRDCRGRYNSPNRGYHNTEPPHIRDAFPKSQLPSQPETKAEVVSADDLLCKPGRDKRPHQVVVIIRGLPGSGKTYVSKLIRDKETNNGGPAPRMLCMDDYFMVEVEKVEKDSESNKMIKKKVLQYEYEPDLEETYRQSILKSFKKTIDDGFFPFIIYDSVNEKVRHFEEFWSYAKSKGFQVYVATVHSDVSTCVKRNIHGRTKQDINKIHKNWEETPKHHIHLDIRCLLQDAAIPEVEMEDTSDEKTKKDATPQKGDAEEEDEPIGPVGYIKSKWEIDVGDQTGQVNDQVLDKLDGIRFGKRRRSASPIFSLDDYLQLDGYRTRQTIPGKKRVRWADMEERKQQLRRRELGFVVGQTQHDWDKITDDSYADRALNRTKYI